MIWSLRSKSEKIYEKIFQDKNLARFYSDFEEDFSSILSAATSLWWWKCSNLFGISLT